MYEIRKQKENIRKKYISLRSQLPDEERRERDQKIASAAAELVSFRHAETVLVYAPIRREIDAMLIALEALGKGKKVAFPRCDPNTRTMRFLYVSSFDELEKAHYGIREPKADAVEFSPKDGPAICFVPGNTFDRDGYRIGYGKGYYDRFLSSFKGSTVGLVYGDFISDRLPRGRFDVPVALLVTEKGVIFTGEN